MKKVVFIISLAMVMMMTIQWPCDAVNISKPPQKSMEELYHDMFISLLGPHIDKAVNDYYSALLTENPTVHPYQVDVVKAKRAGEYRSFVFSVVIEVTPVVGPHISVGKDRLTFHLGAGSGVKLEKFEQLKTFELPPHWQDIIRKP